MNDWEAADGFETKAVASPRRNRLACAMNAKWDCSTNQRDLMSIIIWHPISIRFDKPRPPLLTIVTQFREIRDLLSSARMRTSECSYLAQQSLCPRTCVGFASRERLRGNPESNEIAQFPGFPKKIVLRRATQVCGISRGSASTFFRSRF